MKLPQDAAMLLSYVNTKLRDFYSSLDEFCDREEVKKEAVIAKLKTIDYEYDSNLNKFV